MLVPFPAPACLFGDLVFGTSAGHPWTDFGLPGGTLDPIFLTFEHNLKPNLIQISKTPEQHLDTSETKSSKKQARIRQKRTHNQSKQNRTSCVCLSTPLKPETSGLF